MTNTFEAQYLNLDTDVSASEEGFPFIQWINPQSGAIGLGIKAEQAVAADFQPDERWKLKTLTFGGDKEDCFVSEKPRVIVLNATTRNRPLLMTGEEGTIKFDGDKYHEDKSAWRVFQPVLLAPVDKNLNLLTSSPFIFRVAKASARSFTDMLEEFKRNVVAFYGSKGQKLNPRTLTDSFYAHCVFEFNVKESTLGTKKTPAALADKFVTVTDKNYKSLIIPRQADICGQILSWLEDVAAIGKQLIKEQPEEAETDEEFKGFIQKMATVQQIENAQDTTPSDNSDGWMDIPTTPQIEELPF
jgi:hypothetical protein